MTALTATRTELLRRRSAIAFATQGRDLLVDKRMALVRELHRLDVHVADAREATAGAPAGVLREAEHGRHELEIAYHGSS